MGTIENTISCLNSEIRELKQVIEQLELKIKSTESERDHFAEAPASANAHIKRVEEERDNAKALEKQSRSRMDVLAAQRDEHEGDATWLIPVDGVWRLVTRREGRPLGNERVTLNRGDYPVLTPEARALIDAAREGEGSEKQ